MTTDLHTRNFHCMTTDIELFLVPDACTCGAGTGDPELAADALAETEEFFRNVEARFSRFRKDSELVQLNRAAGRPFPASADLCELVQLAVAAAETSQGIFDPTIIGALEAAGYDRSIEFIRPETAPGLRPETAPGLRNNSARADSSGSAGEADYAVRARALRTSPRNRVGTALRPGGWQDIRVDPRERTVVLPANMRLDLGGIAKGWAVDRATAMLRRLGPGLVNAGGDLRAWGDQPGGDDDGQGWLAAVDNPIMPGSDVAWLWVRDGALATSSTATRRWVGGHHLIDPRTGRPAETDLVSVTALATEAAQAEVIAKVVLVLGQEAGLVWLAERPGVEAMLVTVGGHVVSTPGLPEIEAWSSKVPTMAVKQPERLESGRRSI
jgi:thiamine biosynthesis lipoprotein